MKTLFALLAFISTGLAMGDQLESTVRPVNTARMTVQHDPIHWQTYQNNMASPRDIHRLSNQMEELEEKMVKQLEVDNAQEMGFVDFLNQNAY